MPASTEIHLSDTGKPEAIFISWLLWQPRGADLALEALKEVEKLSRCLSEDPDVIRLKGLFRSLAGIRGAVH
jgi:ribulose bisphosphate carboxylase small subunit